MERYSNEEIIELYKEYMYRASENTVDGYTKHVKKLLSFLDNKSLYDVEFLDIQRFVSYLNKNGNTQSTINNRISGINNFFRYCNKIEINEKKLHFGTQPDDFKKERDNKEVRMNSEMYNKIIESNERYYNNKNNLCSSDYRDKILLYLFIYGAMRRCEIKDLKLEDITLSENNGNRRLKISIKYSKRNKSRDIYLPEKAYYAMNDWIIERKKLGYKSEYIFCSNNDKHLSTKDTLTPRISKKLSERANIKVDNNVITFSPHAYRHGCISMLAKNNVAPIEIAKFSGDTLKVILDTYIHKDSSDSYDTSDCLLG